MNSKNFLSVLLVFFIAIIFSIATFATGISSSNSSFKHHTPYYYNNYSNSTIAGQPTLFSINVTDTDSNLNNSGGYIFSFDNGTGTFINDSFHYFGEVNENSTDWRNGLVGLWHMNDGSGSVNATDASGNGNTGTLTGMNITGNSTSGWNSTDCRFGSCLKFDGVNDYVDAGNASSLNPVNAITIEAWVNSNVLSGYKSIVSRWNTGSDYSYWFGFNGNKFHVQIYDGWAATTAAISTNQWHHLVMSWQPNGLPVLYVDGIQQTVTNSTGWDSLASIKASTASTTIGYYSATYFNGAIDDVAIWNRSLSANEIANLYNSSKYFPTQSTVNVTKTINSTVGSTIRWRMSANDSANSWNYSTVYSLTTTDGTPPQYYSNYSNSTYAGQPTLFSLNWTDNIGLSGYIFSTNNTGTWVNDSFNQFNTTFGKMNLGSSDINTPAINSFILTKQVAPTSGTITQISAYVWGGGSPTYAKGVIFSNDAVNNRPNAKLAESGSTLLALGNFNNFTGLNYNVSSGEVLWIGVYSDSAHAFKGDGGTTNQTYVWVQGSYPTVPSPYNPSSGLSTYNLEASIYATYSPTTAWSNVTKTLNSTVGTNVGWKVYANDTSNNWNTSQTYSLTTTDGQPPQYSLNSTNNTYAGRPTLFRLNWTDNIGLSGYIFSTNNTGSWVNDSFVDFENQTGNVIFKDGFESGDFSKWTVSFGSPTIQSTVKEHGYYAMKSIISGGGYNEAIKNIYQLGRFGAYARWYVRFSAYPSSGALTLARLYDWEGHGVHVNVINDGGTQKWQFRYYNNSWQTINLSFTPLLDTWYSIEVQYLANSSNGVANFWVDGVSLSENIGINTSGTYEPFYVTNEAWYDSGSGTIYHDNIVVSTSYIGPFNSWSNATKTLNSVVGTNVGWRVYANDTSNNWNTSEIFSLTIPSFPARPTLVKFVDAYRIGTSKTNDAWRLGTSGLWNFSVGASTPNTQMNASNLTRTYICTYDQTEYANGIFLSLVHLGDKSYLEYVNFSNSAGDDFYRTEIKQQIDGASTLLGFGKGTCADVDNRLATVSGQTIPNIPIGSYPQLGDLTATRVQISLQYDRLLINGSGRFETGDNKLCINNVKMTAGNEPMIDVSAC